MSNNELLILPGAGDDCYVYQQRQPLPTDDPQHDPHKPPHVVVARFFDIAPEAARRNAESFIAAEQMRLMLAEVYAEACLNTGTINAATQDRLKTFLEGA